jgi:hypothetical protein
MQTLIPPSDAPPARWLTWEGKAAWRGHRMRRVVAQLATADGVPLLIETSLKLRTFWLVLALEECTKFK